MRPNARRTVLAAAADRASVEGLEGLTIGTLAAGVGMSKSGVAGLFASKADLQVATLQAAAERFQAEVIDGADAEPGVARLRQWLDRWLDHIAGAYPGGCLFSSAATELDGRPGQARDVLAGVEARWIDVLASEARLAVRLGELPPSTDPQQLAFELFGALLAANFWAQLLGDAAAYDRARMAIDGRLAGGA